MRFHENGAKARFFFPQFSIVDSKTVQRSALCRSRRELSNEYLLAKIGVDTAENEPLEVWGENSIQYSLHSLVSKRCTGTWAHVSPGHDLFLGLRAEIARFPRDRRDNQLFDAATRAAP